MASIVMDIELCTLPAFPLGGRNLKRIEDPLKYRQASNFLLIQ